MVIWLTGLPGSGKTTISKVLVEQLQGLGKSTVLLDGDTLREALQNFQYDRDSRVELAKTYGRLAHMLSEQGHTVVCATVSMFHEVREHNRASIKDYFEVYLKVSEQELRNRNQKQLYSKAEQGEQKHVHGFDLAIEEPKQPDLTLHNNGQHTPGDLVNEILRGLNYDN